MNIVIKVLLKTFFLLSAVFGSTYSFGFTLPDNFTDTAVISNLQDPDGFAFSPDGRLFISERITGKLRIAKYDQGTDSWILNATPFYTFDIPKDGSNQPEALRSSGLRDIAFDPNFASNGFVYAFYMNNTTRHNRVVRIKASSANPDIADTTFGEQLLLNLPFNNTSSSGSHNGGAIEFGGDGKLFIGTGDGWEGEFAGDSVQSLTTFTGKIFRINSDGSIPSNNPFFSQTTGDYRAIYALGLRNPYSMSKHPDTGVLYINEARGSNKAEIYIVQAGANYGHEGSAIGTSTTPWANASVAGGELITGGAWMPEAGLGNYPAVYNGVYFTALWGSNSSATGRINFIASDSDTAVSTFETGIGIVGANGISVKPVITRIGPEGDLYYLLTTYTTSSGIVRRIKYTSQQTVATPQFSPPGGNTINPVNVAVTTSEAGAQIWYTLDNTTPTTASLLYGSLININQSVILRAKAFKTGFNPSNEASAVYIIGDQTNNQPPLTDAGQDKIVFVGQAVTLDGSGSTDPDGDDDFLTGEVWSQLSGPSVVIDDSTEEIAFFTPSEVGSYQFRLEVSDGIDISTDTVTITVIIAPRVVDGLQVLYTFEEGSGATINDVSGVGAELDLTIANSATVTWLVGGGLELTASANISSAQNSKISNACTASNEISLEAWLLPNNVSQFGPARIISLSSNTTNRNFTLGQEADRYDVRLRTTSTNNNGVPSIVVPASTVKTELSHIVYTRAVDGGASIYLNGVPQVVGSVVGNMNNWSNSYSLLLGNELSGDRPWFGKLFLVAVYCKSLNFSEIKQNNSAGLPPFNTQTSRDDDTLCVPIKSSNGKVAVICL